jgi:hypothetical protein
MDIVKWKPPHENTIDMVLCRDGDQRGVPKDFARVFLFVSPRKGAYTPFYPTLVFKKEESGSKDERWVYNETGRAGGDGNSKRIRPFDMGLLTKKVSHGSFCPDFDPKFNNSVFTYIRKSELEKYTGKNENGLYKVVECRYDSYVGAKTPIFFEDHQFRAKTKSLFVPCRIREDKDGPNNRFVAQNVFASIYAPVTYKDLVGIKKPFNTVIPSKKKIDENMRRFHNVVKRDMTNAAISDSTNRYGGILVDLATGHGGDINKWVYAYPKIKTVIGIDESENMIHTARFGSERLPGAIKKSHGKKHKYDPYPIPDMHFILGDLRSADIKKTIKDQVHPEIGYKKADNISMHMAIHFMFDKKSSLETFLNNVSSNLSVGGRFYGTMIDADEVHDYLKETIVGSSRGDPLIALVTRRYTGRPKAFGSMIGITRSGSGGGKEIREPLSSIRVLRKYAAKYNLKLVSSIPFREYTSSNAYRPKLGMSHEEKAYSYLFRTFEFVKIRSGSTDSDSLSVSSASGVSSVSSAHSMFTSASPLSKQIMSEVNARRSTSASSSDTPPSGISDSEKMLLPYMPKDIKKALKMDSNRRQLQLYLSLMRIKLATSITRGMFAKMKKDKRFEDEIAFIEHYTDPSKPLDAYFKAYLEKNFKELKSKSSK